MTCQDPNCKGCQYNRMTAEEAIRNIHLTPGITALQASTLMGALISMQAQAHAERGESGLYKTLGLNAEAREIEMAYINEFLKEGKNGVMLYAAFTQVLAVYAEKIDRKILTDAMFGAFQEADRKFYPEEPLTTREDLEGCVNNFVDEFLERCLERGRQTVAQRAEAIGVNLTRENMCVHETPSERDAKGDLH